MSAVVAAMAALLMLWPHARPTTRVRGLVPEQTRRRTNIPLGVLTTGGAALAAVTAYGPSAAVAVVIVGAALLHRAGLRRRERADSAALDLLLDAVAVMIAELSVGAHPARACRQAADDVAAECDATLRDSPGSVVSVLTRMAGRAELGGDVAAGVENAGAVHQSSWDRVAVAWRTAEQQGLSMADLLAAVRDDLVARRRFTERTRAALAGARATATVLAFLPVLGIGLGQAMGASPLAVLTGGGLGGILLVVGVGLVAGGLWWTEKITAKVMTP
ncbi:type II secretion system F family protein [Williamsia sp. M5A3_1d]